MLRQPPLTGSTLIRIISGRPPDRSIRIRIRKYTPYANVILTVRDRVLMAGGVVSEWHDDR
jgi:hypothetical protein